MHTSLRVKILLTLVTVTYGRPSLYYVFPDYYDNVQTPSSYLHHHNYQQHPASLLQNIKSQFHTQDELGQYSYGYNDGVSSKIESKNADGTTQGSYSYLDSNGIVQNVNYVADDLNGFLVSATNLPFPSSALISSENSSPVVLQTETVSTITNSAGADSGSGIEKFKSNEKNEQQTIEGSANKSSSNTGRDEDKNNRTSVVTTTDHHQDDSTKSTSSNVEGVSSTISNIGQVPTSGSHIVPSYGIYDNDHRHSLYYPLSVYDQYQAIPSIGEVYNQYHSQDELGQYSYGYSGGPSSKAEVKTADGITRGGYSYIDPNGIVQKVSYISDPINGFRVAGTNLPFPSFPTFINVDDEYYKRTANVERNLNQISENYVDDKSKNISD